MKHYHNQSGNGFLLDVNLFAYCGSNPVNLEDPDRHFWGFLAAIAVIAAPELLVAAAVVAVTVVVVVAYYAVVDPAIHNYYAEKYSQTSFANTREDPYARSAQKKQGREKKEKKKGDDKKWRGNPNKRKKPLNKHTPCSDH